MKKVLFNIPVFIFLMLYPYGRIILDQKKKITLSFPQMLTPFLKEFLIALLLIVILYLLAKRFPVISSLLAMILCVFHLANMEYIYALDHVINLRDIFLASDSEFIKGTLSHISFPGYSISLILILLLSIFMLKKVYWNYFNKKRYSLGSSLGLLIFFLIISVNSGGDWQNTNFISASISNSVPSLYLVNKMVDVDYPADIEGKVNTTEILKDGEYLLQDHSSEKKNVLMVVMEGIPGAYLPAAQDFLDTYNDIKLTSMDKIADHSLIIPNFITHNNQTIRGIYSLISGDYEKLDASTPKSYEYTEESEIEKKPLLAELLKERGYNTEFIQAAALDYMSKGDFMKEAGFDTVIGSEGFPTTYIPFGWGPDDKAFFEQTENYLDDLNSKGEPWFATLLTVGTHHPYAVTDAMEKASSSRKEAAVKYLDEAISDFIDYIDNSSFAENTLVLFVSDESHGVNDQIYGSNWGFMAAYAPNIKGQIINDGVYGHKDVLNSILDYVDPDLDPNTVGRSIFRKYSKDSPILFASHYNGDIFYSLKKGEVYQLDNKKNLYLIKSANGEMFSNNYTKQLLKDDKLKSNILLYSNYVNKSSSEMNKISLIEDKEYTVSNITEEIVTDGQFLTLPAKSYVDINLDYEFLPPETNGSITIYLDEFDNKINKLVINSGNAQGKAKFRFYNEEERTGYSFSLKITSQLTSSETGQLKIKDLNVDFTKTKSNIDAEFTKFNSYNREDIYKLDNLIPFMYTQKGAYINSLNQIDIASENEGILIYGPYMPYKKGNYILRYTLDLKGDYEPPNDVFYIDVSGNTGKDIYVSKTYKLKDLEFDGEQYSLELPFSLIEDQSDIELRFSATGPLNAVITNIETEKLEDQ